MKKISAREVLGAAGRADMRELRRLAAAGADLNAQWRGYRALHNLIQSEPHEREEATTKERLACFEWLLEHGADPELPAAWPPARAMVVAAFGGKREFVDLLVESGARRDVFSAAALGEATAVRRALAKDREVAQARDVGGLTALQCSTGSRMGRLQPRLARNLLEIAGLLLDAGADPNALTKSWSHDIDAAYLACSASNGEMLAILLERGADATAALPSAVWRDGTELAEICLARGAAIDRAAHEGKPLLNQLVRWGQVKPALWLLARGANPNLPDERGWTAVHQAASRGNERMLRACLAAGGDANRKDAKGLTPVVVALAMRKPKMAEILAG